MLEYLDLHESAQVEVDLDRENRQVILNPVEIPITMASVDGKFAHQVAEFIKQYRRPALEKLTK